MTSQFLALAAAAAVQVTDAQRNHSGAWSVTKKSNKGVSNWEKAKRALTVDGGATRQRGANRSQAASLAIYTAKTLFGRVHIVSHDRQRLTVADELDLVVTPGPGLKKHD